MFLENLSDFLGTLSPADEAWIGGYFDASWELGQSPNDFKNIDSNDVIFDKNFNGGQDVLTGSEKTSPDFYSKSRWFEGISGTENGAQNERNDPAKLKCHQCHVRYELKWQNGEFKLVDQNNQEQFYFQII